MAALATGGVTLFAPFAATRGWKWLTETEAAAALALARTLVEGADDQVALQGTWPAARSRSRRSRR